MRLLPKNRLESFSDGVIAIIITIMVLELKAEHQADLDALAKVSGVGVSKLKRYGEDVLRVVREG